MFYEVEMEVAVRKYEVDTERLKALLVSKRKTANKYLLSEELNLPVTCVEHWFRKDKYFAIPDADVWPRLKELLNIETDEFDKSITEYEYRGGYLI